MSLLAPIIAGVSALVMGLAVLIWMNLNQPTLQKSPAKSLEPEHEPSLADLWAAAERGEANIPGYESIVVHHE
jgi:hypothetical protein